MDRARLFLSRFRFTLAVLICCAIPSTVYGQFDAPIPTDVRERISGDFLSGSEGPTPEQGDQIGAFFDGEISVGFFEFDEESAQSLRFSILLYGKLDQNSEGNGPARGQQIEFRYYDSSTNQTFTLDVLNDGGEVVNFTFQGQEVPNFDIPGFDFDDLLTPTRTFDLAPADSDGSGGDGDGDGGNGDGGSTPAGDPDVNADGVVDRRDAALVLRIVIGGPATSAERGRADVDGNGSITTADAVEIYRAINGRPAPGAPSQSSGNTQ